MLTLANVVSILYTEIMPVARYVKQTHWEDASFIEFLAGRKVSRLLLSSGFVVFLLLFGVNIFANSVLQTKAKQVQVVVQESAPSVAGVATESISPTPVLEESAPVAELTSVPRKKSYKIAIFGDSMVDTMGERLEYLEGSLKKKYPETQFELYNYGQGAQNVEEGLGRFTKSFNYQDRNYPSISQIGADIIVIGSFAYNPFSPYDRDKHWLTLTKLVEEAKKTGADVYMLAEIAPLRADFGKGPNGVNWSYTSSFEHSGHIVEQLENAVALAKILNVNLINVFERSVINNQKEVKREYANPGDGIHASVEGHKFTADEIAKTLLLN